MGKLSRNKGAAWEREVANRFKANGYPDAKRGVGQSQSGGNTADVEGTPFWVECKVGQAVNPRAALKQAQVETDGRVPVAVCKDNSSGAGKPAYEFVVFSLEDFLELVRRLDEREETDGT